MRVHADGILTSHSLISTVSHATSPTRTCNSLPSSPQPDSLFATFRVIRDNSLLAFRMAPGTDCEEVTVYTDDMDLAGDVLQELCAWMNIKHMDSVADFPAQLAAFGKTLQQVEDYDQTRQKLSVDMADAAMRVKEWVVRAEDARILNEVRREGTLKEHRSSHDLHPRTHIRTVHDAPCLVLQMGLMQRAYSQLYDVNRELVAEYAKRTKNHGAFG